MHIMNDIQRIHINAGQPPHHILEAFHYLAIFQVLGSNGAVPGAYLLFADLVHTPVYGVQKAFGQIGPGTEKLHFFPDSHGRHTAGYGIVVPMGHPH